MRCSRALEGLINIYVAQTTALGARAACEALIQCLSASGGVLKGKKEDLLLGSLPDDQLPIQR